MKRSPHKRDKVAACLALLAGAAGGVGALVTLAQSSAAPLVFSWEGVLGACAIAIEAAAVEELLFRGLLLWALLSLGVRLRCRRPLAFAVIASAMIFGVLHLLPSAGATPVALSAAVVVQALLKVTEGVLFGTLMGTFAVLSRWFPHEFTRPTSWTDNPSIVLSLAVPVLVHFAFDVLYFAPAMAVGAPMPATYLTGNVPDMLALAVSDGLLAAALLCVLRKGDSPKGPH